MNPTLQATLKYTVVGGSVIMVAGAVGQLYSNLTNQTQKVTLGSVIMPAISILVGVSAFSYAIADNEISVIPKVAGK